MKHYFKKIFVLFVFLSYSCTNTQVNNGKNLSPLKKNDSIENVNIREKIDTLIVSDSIPEKKMSLRDYMRGGVYHPEFTLSENDPLEWPLVYEISMDFMDIKNLDVKNEIFTALFTFSTYRSIPNPYHWEFGKEQGYGEEDYIIPWSHDEDIIPQLKESELRMIDEPLLLEYKNPSDSIFFYDNMVSKEARLIDSEFDLKWNLGNYPFDVQKLLHCQKEVSYQRERNIA